MKQDKNKKAVPTFWWDFKYDGNDIAGIVIESDNDRYPIVAEYSLEGEIFEVVLNEVEKEIDDLKSGRKVIK